MKEYDSDPVIRALQAKTPLLWLNPEYTPSHGASEPHLDPQEARLRFARCAGLIAQLFGELRAAGGAVISPLVEVAALQGAMGGAADGARAAAWLMKRDDALPVAGSIKARGGFHEVLAIAENLALANGLLLPSGDRCVLAGSQARSLFARHTIAVGSTGNLGLSIGLIAARLGFRAVVHMSREAKGWKKQRLRAAGIEVMEHAGDYAQAVDAGRSAAEKDPSVFFVDDEASSLLFLGYAAAAWELADQLAASGRVVDAGHPLFVYIPCGVGGAPGGIAYGLKCIYGRNVHCFFAEPVASPAMLVRLATGAGGDASVYDIGLDNRTEADGLAVGAASPVVAPLMGPRLSGVFTVTDEQLFRDTYLLASTESINLEPSAAAALRGPLWLEATPVGRSYLDAHGLRHHMRSASHVIWSTGGSLVPQEEHDNFQRRGSELASAGLHAT